MIYGGGGWSHTVVIAEGCHWMLGWVYHGWLRACCALNSSVSIICSSYIVLMISCVYWPLLCLIVGLGNHLVLLYYIVVCVYVPCIKVGNL